MGLEIEAQTTSKEKLNAPIAVVADETLNLLYDDILHRASRSSLQYLQQSGKYCASLMDWIELI